MRTTPDPGEKAPTKVRLYRLLLDGLALTVAAKRLKISKQAAHAHAESLEARGALVRLESPRGAPLFYKRGPRSVEFEESTRQSTDRVGRSSRQLPMPGVRLHDVERRVEVLDLTTLPPGGHGWDPNDAEAAPDAWTDYRWEEEIPGLGLLKCWFKRSKTGRVLLTAQAPDTWLYETTEEGLRARKREYERQVDEAVGAVAKRHRLRLAVSKGTTAKVAQMAIPMPGMKPAGKSGVDKVHIDASRGYSEFESTSEAVIAFATDGPRWRDEVDQERAELLDRAKAAVYRLDATDEVLREVVAGLETSARTGKRLLDLIIPQRHDAGPVGPPSPEPDRPEVA